MDFKSRGRCRFFRFQLNIGEAGSNSICWPCKDGLATGSISIGFDLFKLNSVGSAYTLPISVARPALARLQFIQHNFSTVECKRAGFAEANDLAAPVSPDRFDHVLRDHNLMKSFGRRRHEPVFGLHPKGMSSVGRENSVHRIGIGRARRRARRCAAPARRFLVATLDQPQAVAGRHGPERVQLAARAPALHRKVSWSARWSTRAEVFLRAWTQGAPYRRRQVMGRFGDFRQEREASGWAKLLLQNSAVVTCPTGFLRHAFPNIICYSTAMARPFQLMDCVHAAHMACRIVSFCCVGVARPFAPDRQARRSNFIAISSSAPPARCHSRVAAQTVTKICCDNNLLWERMP